MSIWCPVLTGRSGPLYRAIVDALADDVASGRLAVGARLPPHRDLAWRLQCTVGTVARAYAEAARRGLVDGQVGRGTFVVEPPDSPRHVHDYVAARAVENDGVVDMAINRPSGDLSAPAVAAALRRLADRNDLGALLGYQLDGVLPRHRAALARWAALEGVAARPEQIICTVGGQQAILVTLAALSRPGEVILAEELTYPGLKVAAALLDRVVEGVAMDGQGLCPEALDQALRATRARVIYCLPTNQNPTMVVMPLERRQEIIAVARRHGAVLVEDGIYAFLAEAPPPPLWSLAPECCIYLSSLSKAVSPALRVEFVAAPEALVNRINGHVSASTMMVPPLMGEVAAMMIENGAAEEAMRRQAAEARERMALARAFLGEAACPAGPAFNLWLPLPPPWRADAFAAEAYRRGVVLAPAGSFATTRQVPEAVRVSISAPASREALRAGLKVVAELLAAGPDGGGLTV